MNEDKTSIRSLLEKTARSPSPQVAAPEPPDEDYAAYGHGRVSSRTQLMLMFRRVDSGVLALPYACLLSIEATDPSTGFMLDFGRHRVRIAGRTLEHLLRLICQHRVAEIREANRAEALKVVDGAPVVETIQVQSPTKSQSPIGLEKVNR